MSLIHTVVRLRSPGFSRGLLINFIVGVPTEVAIFYLSLIYRATFPLDVFHQIHCFKKPQPDPTRCATLLLPLTNFQPNGINAQAGEIYWMINISILISIILLTIHYPPF